MWRQTAIDALDNGKCLEVRYDGYTRTVEVHVVGRSAEGNDLTRVWQVRGGSKSNERVGWKLLTVSEALGATITDEQSDAPRTGYNRNDPAMAHIYRRV